jgi:ribonucleotide reductase alpha subunit
VEPENDNKRRGSVHIHMELWHEDAPRLIDLKIDENMFITIYIPKLLVKRAFDKKNWSYFCPTKAPLLVGPRDEEFEKAYEKYEALGIAKSTVSAGILLKQLCNSTNPRIAIKYL